MIFSEIDSILFKTLRLYDSSLLHFSNSIFSSFVAATLAFVTTASA